MMDKSLLPAASLTLDQLCLLVAVADEGSFSGAGRRLHRVQSAVSYGIANLERLLDVALFDRGGRTPRLTDAGRALVAEAREVLARVDRLQGRAAALAAGVEAEVAIAVDNLFPTDLLVALCRAFHAQFPAVALRLHTEVLQAVIALVEEGVCQIAVCGPVEGAASLRRRRVGEVAMVAVAASDHPLAHLTPPIATVDLQGAVQIVISERGGGPHTGDRGVLSVTTWRVADATTKLALIRAGLGWGRLPLHLVEGDLAAGRLARLTLEAWGEEPIHAPLYTAVRNDRPPGPAARWLLAEVVRRCGGVDR